MTVIVASVYLPYSVAFDLDKCNSETLEVSRYFPAENSSKSSSSQPSNEEKVQVPLNVASSHIPAKSSAPDLSNTFSGSFELSTPDSNLLSSSSNDTQTNDKTRIPIETQAELPDILQTIKENSESKDSCNSQFDSEQEFFLGKTTHSKGQPSNKPSTSHDEDPLIFASDKNIPFALNSSRRHPFKSDDDSDDQDEENNSNLCSSSPESTALESPTDIVLESTDLPSTLIAVGHSDNSSLTIPNFPFLPTSLTSSRPASPAPDQAIVPPRKPVEPQQMTMRVGISPSPAPGSPLSRSGLSSRHSSAIGLHKLGDSAFNTSTLSSPGNDKTSSVTDSNLKKDDNILSVNKTQFSVFFPEFYNEINSNYADSQKNDQTNARSIALERLSSLYANRNSRKGFSDLAPLLDKVQFKIKRQSSSNGGLHNALKRASICNDVDEVLWVGYPGISSEALSLKTKSAITSTLRKKYHSVPVFANELTFDGCYNHYCKEILWPTMHYQIPDHPKSKAYEDHSWEHYRAFNQHMADSIVKTYKPGDTIWINDYHLLLVPQMVREKFPEAKIGFFLHIAFPSSEVFRVLAARKELLEGVLAANCIGFQIDEYRRHFLQTCNRILTVDFSPAGVRMNNRFISVFVDPIGIDTANLDSYMKAKEVRKWQKEIRDRYNNVTLFVGRDKLDRVKGIKEKLLAYELFLNTYPEMIGKVTLIQVCLMNKVDPDLASDVSVIVDRINGLRKDLGSPAPCVFLHQDIDFAIYIALLYEASSFVITSLREGMNLTCHEFVYCNDRYGPLILSEFTGAASELGAGAILVNPWDRREMAEAYYQATVMSDEEKRFRWSIMNEQVITNTCENWVQTFLKELDAAWNEDQRRRANKVPVLDIDQLRKDYQSIATSNVANSLGSPDCTPKNTPTETPLDTPTIVSSGSINSPTYEPLLNLNHIDYPNIEPQPRKRFPQLKKRIFFLDLDINSSSSIPLASPIKNMTTVATPGGNTNNSNGLLSRPFIRRTNSSIGIFDEFGMSPEQGNSQAELSGSFNWSQLLNSKKRNSMAASEMNLASLNLRHKYPGYSNLRSPLSSSDHNSISTDTTSVSSVSSSVDGTNQDYFGKNHGTQGYPATSTGKSLGLYTDGFPLSKISSRNSTTTLSSLSGMPNGNLNQIKTSTFQYSQRKISMLYELASDSQNIVYVVSNDTRRSLESILKHVGNIGLIAEHGAYIRLHTSNKKVLETAFQDSDFTSDDGTGIGFKEDEGDGWFGLIDWKKTKEWKGMIMDLLKDAREGLPRSVIKEEKTRILLDVSRCLDDYEYFRANVASDSTSYTANFLKNNGKLFHISGEDSNAKDNNSNLEEMKESEVNSREEAREKLFALIGGIVSHVNDSFQTTYNVHARFDAEMNVVEISSESTSKLGGIKRAFEWELRKCGKHNQETAIGFVSGMASSLSPLSAQHTGSKRFSTTHKASRTDSFSNCGGSTLSPRHAFGLPPHENVIDMVFIASKGGDPESDLIFEWGNSLRHFTSSITAISGSAAPGNFLSSTVAAAVGANVGLGGSISSLSTPLTVATTNSPYSINNPLLAGSEFTGLSSPAGLSGLSSSSPFGRPKSTHSVHNSINTIDPEEESKLVESNGASPPTNSASNVLSPIASYANSPGGINPIISTPLATLQKSQQPRGCLNDCGSVNQETSASPNPTTQSLISNNIAPISTSSRRSDTHLSTSYENLPVPHSMSQEFRFSDGEFTVEAHNFGNSGTVLSAVSSSPAIFQHQQPLSGLSGVSSSRTNSSQGLNKDISAALSTGYGDAKCSIGSSSASLPALLSSPSGVTTIPSIHSVPSVANITSNTDGVERYTISSLADNPVVYTVSVDGTGTYAESGVNGVNGLIQALMGMLGQTSNKPKVTA